jgi:excinuclease ABC subunit C
MNSELRRKLDTIPRRPGVYLMKDKAGRIIYVGKAKRLDLRLRSHFSGALDHPKQRAMIRKTVDLDVIATDSDVDALILEMTLIKEKRPVYNINLKDDKRFPFVKVTMQEAFPRIELTRRVKEDGARYFGPYTDVGALRQSLRMLRTVSRSAHVPATSPAAARPSRMPRLLHPPLPGSLHQARGGRRIPERG